MKRIIFGLIVAAAAAAILVPLAVAGGGNSANAKLCQQGGWQGLARQDNTGFSNQDECVSYAAQGGLLKTKPAGPIEVSVPMFNLDAHTCSVTVPYTKGIDTFLYGVNGHPETEAITGDVSVTGSKGGADNTAPQFWIGYKAQPGYDITNLNTAPSHFDFYNGDDVLDCTA